MKVNDVIRKEEAALRVLVIKDDLCLCINCNAESMPAWMPANSLEDYTPDSLLFLSVLSFASYRTAPLPSC